MAPCLIHRHNKWSKDLLQPVFVFVVSGWQIFLIQARSYLIGGTIALKLHTWKALDFIPNSTTCMAAREHSLARLPKKKNKHVKWLVSEQTSYLPMRFVLYILGNHNAWGSWANSNLPCPFQSHLLAEENHNIGNVQQFAKL